MHQTVDKSRYRMRMLQKNRKFVFFLG